MIHAISTGHVKITQNWLEGQGQGVGRLFNTLLDRRHTDWLPIWVYIIESAEGLILVDTGIAANANEPVYFPPHMRLIQRAAPFQITREGEIDQQMWARGLSPDDVRYVVMTHLHQDHDGGMHYFPKAEFIVSRSEWAAAAGFKGRMGGYLNQRWPSWLRPTLIDFTGETYGSFPHSYALTDQITLVPTPGHSAGHLSVMYRDGDQHYVFGGDVAYTRDALFNLRLDGVSGDLAAAEASMRRMRETVQTYDACFLPSHDPDVVTRLENVRRFA